MIVCNHFPLGKMEVCLSLSIKVREMIDEFRRTGNIEHSKIDNFGKEIDIRKSNSHRLIKDILYSVLLSFDEAQILFEMEREDYTEEEIKEADIFFLTDKRIAIARLKDSIMVCFI